MARIAPALSARIVRTQGRGGASKSKTGGWNDRIQGETEGAKKEEGRKDKDCSDKSNNEKDQEEDDNIESTSSEELETKEPPKPPAKTQASTKPSQDNVNEGKEGTSDDEDNDDDLFPRDVEAHHKGSEKGGRPCKGTTGKRCVERLASQMAKVVGDFGTPQNCECQAMFAQVYRISVSRMFVSLGLADDIVNAIVDEQGYDTPHALSCLDKKGMNSL